MADAAAADSAPPTTISGEPRTGRQVPGDGPLTALFGTIGGVTAPGFAPPPPDTWAKYREILRHPTVMLAYYALAAPILGGQWMYETVDEDVPDAYKQFVQDVFESHRSHLCRELMRGAAYGFQAFEKVPEVVAADDMPHTEGLPAQVIRYKQFKSLLPELTEALYDEDTGVFLGARNKSARKTVDVPADLCLWYTHDREGDDYYGTGLCKVANPYHAQWVQTNNRSGQFAGKVAGVVPVIMYPPGVSQVLGGAKRDNSVIAQDLLNNLGLGKGFAVPNLSGTTTDPRLIGELAGKSQWFITFLEVKTDFFSGFIAERKYLDALLVRAFLMLERAVLEAATAGSRADSTNAGEHAISNSELLHAEFCRVLNEQAVDPLLVWNFGRRARGQVYITPAPLSDTTQQQYMQLIQLLLQGQLAPEAASWFNWGEIARGAELPTLEDSITFDPVAALGGMLGGDDKGGGGENNNDKHQPPRNTEPGKGPAGQGTR